MGVSQSAPHLPHTWRSIESAHVTDVNMKGRLHQGSWGNLLVGKSVRGRSQRRSRRFESAHLHSRSSEFLVGLSVASSDDSSARPSRAIGSLLLPTNCS